MKRTTRLIGASLLGLPAAVLAHAATFGQEHVLAGAHHEQIVEIASMSGALLALALALASLLGARRVQSGSILSAGLARYLPAAPALTCGTLLWFSFIEHLEGRSLNVSGILAAVAAAIMVAMLAKAFTRMLAAVTLACFAQLVRERRPRTIFIAFDLPLTATLSLAYTRRLGRAPPRLA
ncbi:MAG: hypothetical protein ACXWNJ_14080 [Vulcanimicrobiaceae bacterium]